MCLLETYNREGSTTRVLLAKVLFASLHAYFVVKFKLCIWEAKKKMTKNNLCRMLRDRFLVHLGFHGQVTLLMSGGLSQQDLPLGTTFNTVTFLCTCFNAPLIYHPLSSSRDSSGSPRAQSVLLKT